MNTHPSLLYYDKQKRGRERVQAKINEFSVLKNCIVNNAIQINETDKKIEFMRSTKYSE